MDIYAKPVLTYRWITFLLAGGYCLYQVMSADYSQPGGPFRLLAVWALFLSFYSASRMLARSERRIDRTHQRTAMCAAVLNVMVVFLYWRLYLVDPALVDSAHPEAWHQQYYLHALGPALQIFDALFIGRVFRKPLRAAAPLHALLLSYVAWAELFVRTQNDTPVGTVTSGLPYPFLNSLDLGDRLVFYATHLAIAMCVLVGLALLANWLTQRADYGEELRS